MKKVREGYKEYEFGVIPNDWQVKKLGDIFNDLKGGSTPSRLIDRYYTGDIPWITSGELKYKTIYNTLESITEEAVKDTNLKLYPQGTFFIAITGLEAEGTRGSCAITGVPATTNQSCLAFQPKEGFSNLYLYHWYRLYGNYIGLKYTQGTKQQSLNNKIVGKLEIPVPKLEEQEKIASILSTVDEQIDNVDALIEKNKELKKGLMQTLLTKGIGHIKFKKTEIGEIPEEWYVKKVGDICEVKGGKRLPKGYQLEDEDTAFPYIRVADMYMGGIRQDDIKYVPKDIVDKIKNYKISKDDLFISVAGTLGIVGQVPYELDGANLTENADKLCNIQINKLYLMKVLQSNIIQSIIEAEQTKSAQPKLALTRIKEFLIPVPSDIEQVKIASILMEVDEKIGQYENKKQKLEELKKGLMQQLLTGRIRV